MSPCYPAPSLAHRGVMLAAQLNLSSSSPAAGMGCLGAAGEAAGPARRGSRAAPRCRPWWSPPSQPADASASEIQLSREGGRGSWPGGAKRAAALRRRRGSATRALGSAARAGTGAASHQGGPVRGRAASCGVGGSQAAGRRGQRAGPGAGSCGTGSPRRSSNFCCLSPCAQTAFRRRRYAAPPQPQGGGLEEGAGARRLPGVPPQPSR